MNTSPPRFLPVRRAAMLLGGLATVMPSIVARAAAAEPGYALGPVAMDAYAQTVVVTLKSAAAASRARLSLAPLYHDLRAAVSTRMDDCNLNDLAVAQIMAKHGQHGTFYLNNPENWWQDSPATGIDVSGDRGAIVPPRLLSGGNSIGGHTLSHEFLPALSANAAFREIMGGRVLLETKTASPVRSFVYPFVCFQSPLRAGCDRSDVEEMLRRAGIYQLAEDHYNRDWDSGLQDGVFVALDGRTEGYPNSTALTTEWCAANRPLFLITMHPWVSAWGGGDMPKLVALYREWSGRADCWYCNQNQYAAYRYQARHSRLETRVEGHTVRAVLIRPDPLDLDDWTPLTLRVDDVARDDVVAVECAGADVKPVPLADAYAFDLFHGRDRGAIEACAQTESPGDGDALAPAATAEGLQARLARKDRTLTLVLRNSGPETLRDLRITFRLPLRWQEGVVRRNVGALAGGAGATLEVPLTERADPEHYADGREYDVAQIDFRGRRRVRLYAVGETPAAEPPAFFAARGFWTLGPLPADSADFDWTAWAQPFLDGREPPDSAAVPGGGRLAWGALPRARVAILDPDIIPTTGKSNLADYYKQSAAAHSPPKSVRFLLWGRIVSPEARSVRLVADRSCVRALALNGRKVEGDELELRAGANDVRMLYGPAQAVPGLDRRFDLSNYGCYFRLVDTNGKRVHDVRFEPPPLPAP